MDQRVERDAEPGRVAAADVVEVDRDEARTMVRSALLKLQNKYAKEW